jgi:hypothetical protein
MSVQGTNVFRSTTISIGALALIACSQQISAHQQLQTLLKQRCETAASCHLTLSEATSFDWDQAVFFEYTAQLSQIESVVRSGRQDKDREARLIAPRGP